MSKWEMVRLEDVCNILDSMRIPITASERTKGEYPYYGANGIQDYVANFIFDDELVLLAEDGGNFGSKEKPIAYRVSGKCWVNNHAHVLKPQECLNVDYLCYSIMFYDVSKLISGTTRAKLNQSAVRKMTIPLPPMEVQQKIAQTLDAAAALISLRKQQLAELDNLIKSVFYEMFGDPVANEKGWKKKHLGEVSCVKIGPFGSLLHREDYIKGGIPLINPSHIIDGKICPDVNLTVREEMAQQLSQYRMDSKSVILGRRGEIGRCAVVGEKEEGFLCGTGSLLISSLRDLNPVFLFKLISTTQLKNELENVAQGVTMKNLNSKIVEKFEVPVPPLPLQTQFAEIVTKIEEQKALVQKAIDESQYLFDSLMNEYFN